jgi:hypothetical protein
MLELIPLQSCNYIQKKELGSGLHSSHTQILIQLHRFNFAVSHFL